MAWPVIPFEEIAIESPLPGDEVMRRLVNNIEIVKTESIFDRSKQSGSRAFHGTVKGHEFTISRSITYKNSFLPTINGHIRHVDNKTHITLKLKLRTEVIVFMCVWLGFVTIAFVTSLFNDTVEAAAMTGGMLIVGYLLPMFSFARESISAKKLLIGITQGTIVDENQENTTIAPRYSKR